MKMRRGCLGKAREVYLKEQDESIPTLKAVDKRKVRAKSEMVNRILHNFLEDKMDVIKVNRLLYAGAWEMERGKRRKNHIGSEGYRKLLVSGGKIWVGWRS